MNSNSQNNMMETCGFTCYWRIENFNYKPNCTFESLSFKIKTLKSKWHLTISEEDDCLGVFLFKATNSMFSHINFTFSLLTGAGWIPFEDKINFGFRAYGEGHGVRKIVSVKQLIDEQWNYLPNGSLTVSVRIWIKRMRNESNQCLMISRLINGNVLSDRPIETFTDLKPSDLLMFPYSYVIHVSRPIHLKETEKEVKTQFTQTETGNEREDQDGLIQLFKEEKFSFVTLRTPTRDFSVHKAVLCAKSPVFKAMFDKDMKEKECNLVDIDDVDDETMASLLKFLHLEPLGGIKYDAAVTLYYAADKYQIGPLKEKCVLFLEKGLTVENICDAFLLADLHQDKDLKNCALEYFCKNSKLIFLSKNWKELVVSYSELVAEILFKMAEKM